jgi:hypothetical protein
MSALRVLQAPEDPHESFSHDLPLSGVPQESAGAAAMYDASFCGVTPDGGIAIAFEDVKDAPGIGHGVRRLCDHKRFRLKGVGTVVWGPPSTAVSCRVWAHTGLTR